MISSGAYNTTSGAIDAIAWVASYAFVGGVVFGIFKLVKSRNRSSLPRKTSIVIGLPDYQIDITPEMKSFLDSLEQFPDRTDGWYKDPSGQATLRYHFKGRWTPATVSSNSEDEKSIALTAIFHKNQESKGQPLTLYSFLKGLPAPLGPAIKLTEDEHRGSWRPDPVARWARRFNQGSTGGVGWTNRVLDSDGNEILDDLTFEELSEMDTKFPFAPEPSPISHDVPNAGWFIDPTGYFKERFWSGQTWTTLVRNEPDVHLTWTHTNPPRPTAAPTNAQNKIQPVRYSDNEVSDDQSSESRQVSDQGVSHVASQSKESRVLAIARLLEDGLISRAEFLEMKTEIFYNSLDNAETPHQEN